MTKSRRNHYGLIAVAESRINMRFDVYSLIRPNQALERIATRGGLLPARSPPIPPQDP